MFKQILQSRWFTFVAIAVVGLVGMSTIKIIPSVTTVVRATKNLDQKIQEEKSAEEESNKLSDYLKSDAYLERQARLRLNYKKPDESVVFVYKNLYNQPNDKTQSVSQPNPVSRFFSGLVQKIHDWWSSVTNK